MIGEDVAGGRGIGRKFWESMADSRKCRVGLVVVQNALAVRGAIDVLDVTKSADPVGLALADAHAPSAGLLVVATKAEIDALSDPQVVRLHAHRQFGA